MEISNCHHNNQDAKRPTTKERILEKLNKLFLTVVIGAAIALGWSIGLIFAKGALPQLPKNQDQGNTTMIYH